MKRSNFTFLFLFVLVGLGLVNVSAQNACNGQVNVSLNADCRYTINTTDLSATAAYTSLTLTGYGIPAAGSGVTLGTPVKMNHPLGTYTYTATNASGPACWGQVTFENKNTPTPTGISQSYMCGQAVPAWPAVGTNFGCIDYSKFSVEAPLVEIKDASICDNDTTFREVYGTITVDGKTTRHLLRRDTLIRMPLLIGAVVMPAQEVTISSCGSNPEQWTPGKVADHFDAIDGAGFWRAYPYLVKGTTTTTTTVRKDTIVDSTATIKVEVIVGGKPAWVTQSVVFHKDSAMFRTVTRTSPIIIHLKDVNNSNTSQTTCNLNVKCQDMILPTECGANIMRTWNVIDWCNAKASGRDTVQWVKIQDITAPAITAPAFAEVHKAPWTCKPARPTITVSDNCTPTAEIRISVTETAGTKDTLIYTWKAIDKCGNIATRSTKVVAVDKVAPVVVAEDRLNVSLTGDHEIGSGIAKVYAKDIDAGSHDAGCGDVWTCVLREAEFAAPLGFTVGGKRAYKPAGCAIDGTQTVETKDKFGNVTSTTKVDYVLCKDFVKFCCTDKGVQRVVLVATDLAGNTSHGWSEINVEDKSKPIFQCPGDITFNCANPYSSLRIPTLTPWPGVCGGAYTVTTTGPELVGACPGTTGTINYTVTDNATKEVVYTCSIKVTMVGTSSFDPRSIKWPKHQTGDVVKGKNLECRKRADGSSFTFTIDNSDVKMGDAMSCSGAPTGKPTWCNAPCSLIASSFQDQEVKANDACKKIIRRWTVIDWCTYKPNGNNVDDENDTATDQFEAIEDWAQFDAGCRCEKPSDTQDAVYFRYTNVDRDGYYTYDQVVEVFDNAVPKITAPATFTVGITGGASAKGGTFEGCVGSGTVTASATDVCGTTALDPATLSWWIEVRTTGGTVLGTRTATGASATMGTTTAAPGATRIITWIVKDGCGNQASASTTVTFRDTKKPTPLCVQDLSTATMNINGSTVGVWAKDYNLGSFDNCSDVKVYFKNAAGNSVDAVSFGCADIPNGVSATKELRLFVADASGNEDFCYVTLRIDDNNNICPNVSTGAGLVSGEVKTFAGDMVESAKVSLSDVDAMATKVDGKYAFANVPTNANYEVSAKKNDDFMNGISTYDLVLIQRHILGLGALDNGYKVIAADVNNDTRVTGTDLVELRKLILGIYTELPNNTSWRFADASAPVSVANPFPFKEAIAFSLDGQKAGQDFIAIKVGDVSGDAFANSLIAAGARSTGSLNLEVADAVVKAGQEISVPVRAANFNNIAAYQMTLEVAGLELVKATSGAIEVSSENFATINANTITTAWSNANGVSASDVLFTLTFKATANTTLSEALAVSSSATTAAAYTAGAEKLDVVLAFNKDAAGFTLSQNEPNPFDNITRISFNLPTAGSATLTVFDVTGKTVKIVNGEYAKGTNTITLKKSDLNASGVLYYQLESGDFTATKKMVVIE